MSAKNEKAGRRRSGKKGFGAGKPINIKKIIVSGVVAFFAIAFVYTFVNQQITLSQKNRQIEELTEKVAVAKEETERLQQEVDNLSDPEYIEKIARERLGLVRPNERIFVDSNKSEDNSGR